MQSQIGLVLMAEPVPDLGLPLYVAGSAGPNAVGTTTLVTAGALIPEDRSLPLYLLGSPMDRAVRPLNLYVGGTAGVVSGAADLVVFNGQVGVDDWAPLFLKVDGTLLGGQVAEGRMVLFLGRQFEAAATLFVAGPGSPLPSSAPLFACGSSSLSGEASLVMPSTVWVMEPTAKLYTSGW